ncbi:MULTISPECIES: hypothetical protein [Haloarcula]|uniref:hypothetical protein n=1 Tax=Haloarcula TaxID=2237 RepID=UPI0023E7DBBD|nr:hypothetical protein [Halomicroarcula sp. SHR3]
MARDDTGGDAGNEHHTSRRAVLRAAGAATLALGASGVASAQTDTETVVDLGNEGLTDGDSIDSYLETHLADGVEVQIPAGTYTYTGAGLGGEYANAALVGSTDGVEFQRPEDPETTVTPSITATGGTVRIENITVTGETGQAQSRWEVGAAADASVHLLNVNFPDGSIESSESMGVYAQESHAGLLWVKSCHFASFANVALHASAPAGSGDGRIVVEDCSFVNTGTAAVRVGPDNTTVRGSYFEATAAAPAGTDGTSQHGVQVPVSGGNLTVTDCDFNWAGPGTSVVDFAGGGEGGSGTLSDLRVGYGDQETLFTTGWEIESGWTGDTINVSEA